MDTSTPLTLKELNIKGLCSFNSFKVGRHFHYDRIFYLQLFVFNSSKILGSLFFVLHLFCYFIILHTAPTLLDKTPRDGKYLRDGRRVASIGA